MTLQAAHIIKGAHAHHNVKGIHARPVAKDDVLPSMPRWMYGYGMHQAAAAAADSLILLFVASVLGGSPIAIGFADAIGSLGTIAGAIALSLWIRRVNNPQHLFVGGFLAVGLSLLPFAFLSNMLLAFMLALAEGLLLAPSSLAPVVASNHLPRPLWSSAFSYLNKASSIGSAIGIGLSAIWLLGGTRFLPGEAVMRLVFVGLAALAVIGAVWSHHFLLISRSQHGRHVNSQKHHEESEAPSRSRPDRSVPLPLFNDQMVFFLVASFFMFAGFGMSYSGMHTYLIKELRAPLGFVMAALLVLRLFSYSVSSAAAQGLAKHFPVRMQSLAALARTTSMVLIALIGILAPTQIALPFVLTLVALWGLSIGVVAVAGMQSVAHLSTPGRFGQSQTLYTAVVNAGAILGAWGGGILASYLGFSPMFLIAAIFTSLAILLLMRS